MYDASLVDELDEERTPVADEAVEDVDKRADVDELDEVDDDLGDLDAEPHADRRQVCCPEGRGVRLSRRPRRWQ